MSKTSWSAPTSSDEAHRRAAGRRRYNSVRTFKKKLRRQEVADYLRMFGMGYGVQAKIARALGVSEATISRDVAALMYEVHHCPTCRRVLDRQDWQLLADDGHVTLSKDGVELPQEQATPSPAASTEPGSIAALDVLCGFDDTVEEIDGAGDLPVE